MARLAEPTARADSPARSDSADSLIVLAAADDSSKATPSTAATSVTDKDSPDAAAPSEKRASTTSTKKPRASTGGKTRTKQATLQPPELIPPKARTLLGFGFTKNHETPKSQSEPRLHMPKRASPRRVSPRKPSSFLADPSDDEPSRQVSSSSIIPLLAGQEAQKPVSPPRNSTKKRLAEEMENTQPGAQESEKALLLPKVEPHRDLSGATTLVEEEAEHPPAYTESVEKKEDASVAMGKMGEEKAEDAEEDLEEPIGSAEVKPKKSVLGKLKGKMASVATTIGKRKRDVKDALERGKEKLQSHGSRKSTRASKFTGDFMSKLPALEEEYASAGEEPPSKKLKRTPASAPTLLTTTPSAPKQQATSIGTNPIKPGKPPKHWLTTGMFMGQTRHWDANLTTEKNLKKLKTRFPPDGKPPPERKLLPLPLFHADPDIPALVGKHWNFVLPFDVYHPLPPGQPKPDEWRKTGTNKVVGDAARVMREINDFKRRETSFCMCRLVEEGGEGCSEDCMNRFMGYQCDEKTCALSAEQCGNRPFAELKERLEGGKLPSDTKSNGDSKGTSEAKNSKNSKIGTNSKTAILTSPNRTRSKEGKKYDVGVEVFKTTDKGFGVRACRTFEPGQIITEYAGEMVTNEEAERRMVEEYADAKCYYLLSLSTSTHSTPLIIDGTRGSLARFINHSCTPNSSMIQFSVQGHPRMALFAGPQGIMTGEELTYDYNFDNFNKEAVTVCRCGSVECRGYLGKKLSEQEVRRRLKEARSKAEKEAAEEARRVMEEQKRLEEGKKKRKGNWRGYAAVDEEGNVVDREEWEREKEELDAREVEEVGDEEEDARPRKRARLTGTVSRKGRDGVTKSRSVLRKKGLKL